MGRQASSPIKAVVVSTAGLLLSGLISFFYTFFAQVYPKTEARIDVLAEKARVTERFEEHVTSELKEIRVGQKELYQLLLEDYDPRNK
jgi:hypothetical protein